jgi:hypothetical protein
VFLHLNKLFGTKKTFRQNIDCKSHQLPEGFNHFQRLFWEIKLLWACIWLTRTSIVTISSSNNFFRRPELHGFIANIHTSRVQTIPTMFLNFTRVNLRGIKSRVLMLRLEKSATIRDCLLGHHSIYRHGPIHILVLIRVYRVWIEGIHSASELKYSLRIYMNISSFMACRILSREGAQNGKNGLPG